MSQKPKEHLRIQLDSMDSSVIEDVKYVNEEDENMYLEYQDMINAEEDDSMDNNHRPGNKQAFIDFNYSNHDQHAEQHISILKNSFIETPARDHASISNKNLIDFNNEDNSQEAAIFINDNLNDAEEDDYMIVEEEQSSRKMQANGPETTLAAKFEIYESSDDDELS